MCTVLKRATDCCYIDTFVRAQILFRGERITAIEIMREQTPEDNRKN